MTTDSNRAGPGPGAWGGMALAFTSAFAGVMLAIGVGLGGYGTTMRPNAYARQFGAVYPYLAPCVGMTLVPAFAATLVALRRTAPGSLPRRDWRVALGGILATIAVTLVYHMPANLRLWSGELDPGAIRSEQWWWLGVHALRMGTLLLGIAAMVRAIARDGRGASCSHRHP